MVKRAILCGGALYSIYCLLLLLLHIKRDFRLYRLDLDVSRVDETAALIDRQTLG